MKLEDISVPNKYVGTFTGEGRPVYLPSGAKTPKPLIPMSLEDAFLELCFYMNPGDAIKNHTLIAQVREGLPNEEWKKKSDADSFHSLHELTYTTPTGKIIGGFDFSIYNGLAANYTIQNMPLNYVEKKSLFDGMKPLAKLMQDSKYAEQAYATAQRWKKDRNIMKGEIVYGAPVINEIHLPSSRNPKTEYAQALHETGLSLAAEEKMLARQKKIRSAL